MSAVMTLEAPRRSRPQPAQEPATVTVSLRVAPWIMGVAAWVLVLVGGWWFMNSGETREISTLRVDGPFKRVSAHMVAQAVQPLLSNGFVQLQLDELKADAESLPWVARARVERSWPAGVRVRVWEREPFARWGEASLLDTGAQVFTPKVEEIPGDLPHLAGAAGHEQEVMDTYKKLSAELAGTPFALAGLALDARGEWTALTQVGIGLRLGATATLDDKIELLEDTAARTLQARMGEVDYVDLRYTNGFAVGWKQAPPTGKATGQGSGDRHG